MLVDIIASLLIVCGVLFLALGLAAGLQGRTCLDDSGDALCFIASLLMPIGGLLAIVGGIIFSAGA